MSSCAMETLLIHLFHVRDSIAAVQMRQVYAACQTDMRLGQSGSAFLSGSSFKPFSSAIVFSSKGSSGRSSLVLKSAAIFRPSDAIGLPMLGSFSRNSPPGFKAAETHSITRLGLK